MFGIIKDFWVLLQILIQEMYFESFTFPYFLKFDLIPSTNFSTKMTLKIITMSPYRKQSRPKGRANGSTAQDSAFMALNSLSITQIQSDY